MFILSCKISYLKEYLNLEQDFSTSQDFCWVNLARNLLILARIDILRNFSYLKNLEQDVKISIEFFLQDVFKFFQEFDILRNFSRLKNLEQDVKIFNESWFIKNLALFIASFFLNFIKSCNLEKFYIHLKNLEQDNEIIFIQDIKIIINILLIFIPCKQAFKFFRHIWYFKILIHLFIEVWIKNLCHNNFLKMSSFLINSTK
jgi:hypothetical protein